MDRKAFLLIIGILLSGAAWGATAAGPALAFSAGAGAIAGLDRLLRGAEAGLELGLAWSGASGGGEGLGCGLVVSAAWDGTFHSAFLRTGLRLSLGPSLSLEAAWELPISEARLDVKEASTVAIIEPAGLPCRLAARVVIARLGREEEGRPRILVTGELSWTSYRVVGTEGSPDPATTAAMAEALAGGAGFAAGFRATICLVLSWQGPPRPTARRP
jgi:hypothetical protein